MGWSKGSMIMTEIIENFVETISDDEYRAEAYSALIDIFEDHDCDTLHECLEIDEVFDDVFHEKHPDEDAIEEESLEDWDDQSGGSF